LKRKSIYILLLGVVLSINTLVAQKLINMPTYDEEKYHFGFILAVNQMHFVINPKANFQFEKYGAGSSKDFLADSAYIYSMEDDPSVGFTVGIVGNLRLGKYTDLRFIPSLSFGERNLLYRIKTYTDGNAEFLNFKKNIASTFIDFPLLLKYKTARRNNYRAYIIGGISPRLDLASQFKRTSDNISITQVKLSRFDMYGEIGVGFDFYFDWFKLGTEIKMSYGMLDMIKKENNIYTEGIDKLSSKIFQFTFSFE